MSKFDYLAGAYNKLLKLPIKTDTMHPYTVKFTTQKDRMINTWEIDLPEYNVKRAIAQAEIRWYERHPNVYMFHKSATRTRWDRMRHSGFHLVECFGRRNNT